MLQLFVVGTVWFWVMLVALLGTATFFLENESGLGATVTLILGGVILYFLGEGAYWTVIPYILANPLLTLGLCMGYFIVGAAWSMVKWRFELTDLKRAGSSAPLLIMYSKKFVRWIGYWPLSVLAFLFSDLFRRISRTIASNMMRIYQRMADSVFAE